MKIIEFNPELFFFFGCFSFAGSLTWVTLHVYTNPEHAKGNHYFSNSSILWPNSEILEIYYEIFRFELCYYLQHNLVWFAVLAVSCFSIAEVH